MNQQVLPPSARGAIEAATALAPGMLARFYLPVPEERNLSELNERIASTLAPLACTVSPMSVSVPGELMLSFPDRTFVDSAGAFDAARALESDLALPVAEPEIFHAVMAVEPGFPVEPDIEESAAALMPGCWADPEPRIEQDHDWALKRIRIHEAWDYAERQARPSRGEGIVIAQPDTGVTRHPELHDVLSAGAYNLVDPSRPNDATDPMDYAGTPGHGTGTASVLISGAPGAVHGSAPRARHMPIRAIHSVMRLSQTRVAQAMDRAVDEGADVITMSLGGIYSFALQRALERAVAADVIVLAAAGNCVNFVVWPARFDDCIAVAGTDYDDAPWRGSCRGPDVDIAAPAQNVYRASAQDRGAGQGQGTSFAVALTAGVAACWLAYHGRASVIAAAHAQHTSVQKLFRRMLQATARTPQGEWDVYSMGPGIVDALALLQADFDTGRDTEGPEIPESRRPLDRSIRGFALETAFAPAQAQVDWVRHGPEASLLVLHAHVRSGCTVREGGQVTVEVSSKGLAAALENATGNGALPSAPAPEAVPPSAPQSPPENDLEAPPLDSVSFNAAPIGAPALRLPSKLQAPPAPPDEVQARRRILAAGQLARPGGGRGGLEGMFQQENTLPPDARLPEPDAVLGEVERIAKALPQREIGDPQAFRQAMDILLRHGDRALRKLLVHGHGPGHDVNADELGALEAIIETDGSRPSFLLDDGLPPEQHPFYGIWETQIKGARTRIQQAARAIGRIQPKGGHASSFLGTGSLVDRDKQYVLTNFHVLDDARTKLGIPMTLSGSTLTVHGGLEIDFVGEAGGFGRNRFQVTGALLPAGYGRGFGFVDAALLRIEAIDDASVLPAAAIPLSADPAFANGGMASVFTIGFPGRPQPTPNTEVDWGFVITTLFGDRFGFKRLAPGRFTQALATDVRDTREIVFGHDASTFGGASGSLLFAHVGEGHFAGVTKRANHAISAAAAAQALRAIGVPM
jgi:serine protease